LIENAREKRKEIKKEEKHKMKEKNPPSLLLFHTHTPLDLGVHMSYPHHMIKWRLLA